MREIMTHRPPLDAIGNILPQDVDNLNQFIRLEAADEPSRLDPVNYKYQVFCKAGDAGWAKKFRVEFQKGPHLPVDNNTGERIGTDVNGISPEALVAVLIDHLRLRGKPVDKLEEVLVTLKQG